MTMVSIIYSHERGAGNAIITKDHIIVPDIAEATTALRTTNFSCELGFYGGCRRRFSISKKMKEIQVDTRAILNCLQKYWTVNHVRRNLNGAAHCLANAALSLTNDQLIFS